MSLIAILLSLLIERYLGTLHELRRFDWLASLSHWARRQAKDGLLGYIATFAPVVLVLMIAFWLLPGWLDFALGVLVLLYSLGPYNLNDQSRSLMDAMARNDAEAVAWYAQRLSDNQALPAQPELLCHHVTETLLVQHHDRTLAVLFWFVVLGPVGAALYRISSQLRLLSSDETSEFSTLARQFNHLLAWLPARLTALAYALSGSLNHTLTNWRTVAQTGNPLWQDSNDRLLAHTGMGALMLNANTISNDNCVSQTEQALELINRSTIVWVCVIAVMTIAGFGS